MSEWLINGASPESYGVVVAGGQFASGSVSTVRLERVSNFDAAEAFAYGTAVTITRDGTAFFKGKVRAIPKHADGGSEGQSYIIEDVWADLERLTYQEPWAIRQTDYTGTAYSPTVILGLNSAGTRIGVGTQIQDVIAFAEDAGLDLTSGGIPAGMLLWPSEVVGMSCAEVIRTCLRFYPDWIPWIDHTNNPPVLNVTPRADATARTLAVTACEDFSVTKTQDRVPDGVRICYMTAASIGDEVYRSMSVDQAPRPGGLSDAAWAAILVAPAGPGILTTTVELAGMKVQIQKQQVQTRAIPTSDDFGTTAKAYLKKKFPFIADIADANFTVADWTRTVVTDTEETIDPIDSKMARQLGTTLAHMPRELVKGNVAEWMRRRVGKITLNFSLGVGGGATSAEAKLLAKIPTSFTVTGTNAITKIYKGISSYEAGDARPTGIALAYYNTLLAGCYFEGSATLTESDVGATRWHGSKLHLSGGVSEWATMGAPIHTVDWDLVSCQTTLNFGPNPDYSVQDFVEFLRLLNKRPYSQFTTAERTGDGLGSEGGVSARGDSVGGFDIPETTFGGGGGLNANIQIAAWYESSTGTIYRGDPAEDTWLVFRDGSLIANVSAEPADTPAGLVSKRVVNITEAS